MPVPGKYDGDLLEHMEAVKEVITQIRGIRNEKNIPPREPLQLMVRSSSGAEYPGHLESIIIKLANLSAVEQFQKDPSSAVSFMVRNVEYKLPLEGLVDHAEEIEKLENELEYTRGFLASVQKKMHNEQFVQHAPAQVVDRERQKLADAEAKIAVLESQVRMLKEQA